MTWRGFDVAAVLDSLPFEGATVVAGASGLQRQVSGAALAPDAPHLQRATAGELVVTTTSALRDTGEDSEHLVARLDGARVAGLAVRLDAPEGLPAGLAAAADQLACPVITFPAGSSLADVGAAVLDALLAAQGRRLERVFDIHQRFTRIVLAGGGVTEVATTLHDLLGHPVAVVDPDGRPVVTVPADAAVEAAAADEALARHPVRAGDVGYGEILALTGGAGLDPDGSVALERAAEAVAVRFAQAAAVAETQERFAAVSLEELIAGHPGAAAAAVERAVTFGWDLARPRAVLLASIDPPESGAVPSAALGTIAAAARATLGREAIVWTRTATIAALIAPEGPDAAERRRLAEALRGELDVRLRSVSVSIGVGRRVETLEELPRSLSEARRAVDVGRWARGRHVTEVFDELGLERLLASAAAEDLAEFVQHTIGALASHDRSHRTELVATLATWLETRNMAEAARQMHVHYNTLKNRLDRIEAIAGPVLDDPARALECEMAIYVARHFDLS